MTCECEKYCSKCGQPLQKMSGWPWEYPTTLTAPAVGGLVPVTKTNSPTWTYVAGEKQ
jgi:hypothetical protein